MNQVLAIPRLGGVGVGETLCRQSFKGMRFDTLGSSHLPTLLTGGNIERDLNRLDMKLEKNLTYTIKKSRRARALRVTVNCDASVVVTTPFWLSERRINHFLRQKMDWILKKVSYFKSLGALVHLPRGQRAFVQYKNQAHNFVASRMEELNKQYNFSFNIIAIKNSARRWGSCSQKKNLNFSFRILFLPPELADYVIVHELCHLQEFNHSKRFWALVAQTVPDFRVKIKALRRVV